MGKVGLSKSVSSLAFPYKELFGILTAPKLEREQNFDEAWGGGAREVTASRSNLRAARMRKSTSYGNACYAGYILLTLTYP